MQESCHRTCWLTVVETLLKGDCFQLQMNDLQKEIIQHKSNQTFIFTYLLCNCTKLFVYSILTTIFEFLMFIST